MPYDMWVPATTDLRRPRVADEQSIIWRVAVNILNKQSQTADKRWSSGLGF